MSEKEEQRAIIDYVERLGYFIYAIPSVKFSRQQGGFPVGYKKGMPDLHIPALNHYHETKDIKPSKVKEHEEIQLTRHEQLRQAGSSVSRGHFEIAKEAIDKLHNERS